MKQPILLSNDTISGLCRGLSLLLHAGVGVGDGLALLAQEEESPALRAVLDEMARQMDDGSPLAAALRKLCVRPGGGGRAVRAHRRGPGRPGPPL